MKRKVADSKVKKPRRARSETIELGSGNVFADLGFPDAEERLRKAQAAINASLARVEGRNRSASEIARDGQGLVRQRREKIKVLRKELAIGLDELDRGEYFEYASVEELFDDIKPKVTKPTAKKPRTS